MNTNKPSRRRFLAGAGASGLGMLLGSGCRTAKRCASSARGPIQFKSKEVFIPSQNGTGVFPGFVTYIDRKKPVLLNRFGWVDASDTYDNFHEIVSEDNGRSWSEPVLKLASYEVLEGRIRYCENTAFFDADTNLLITAVSKFLYPKDHFNQDMPRQLEISISRPGSEPKTETYDFGLPGGIGISFCFPIKTKSGKIVIPAMKASTGPDGEFLHHPKSGLVINQVRMVIGEYAKDGELEWHVGQPLNADPERSTRGFSESTPVELHDGRLAVLCRGSNARAPELPGYKWLSFSEDDGETWSEAAPCTDTEGVPIGSSATGAACFRSIKNGRLYFIGNLCPDGVKADGNWPRSPLVIAEVQEEPFSIKKDTITVIDERGPSDTERTQISNFRYYQDRENGDVVVFASRFGERDMKQWKWANHYRYRVSVDSF